MVIEDPFEDRFQAFGLEPADMKHPTRSPSPVRGLAGRSLAEIKAAVGDADDEELVFLEEDVELE